MKAALHMILVFILWSCCILHITANVSSDSNKTNSITEVLDIDAIKDSMANILSNTANFEITLDSLTRSSKSDTQLGVVYLETGKLLVRLKMYTKADSLLNISDMYFEKCSLWDERGGVYFQRGLIAKNLVNATNVFDFFSKAEDFYKISNNHKGIIYSNLQKGIFFSKNGNFAIAEASLKAAVSNITDECSPSDINLCYLNFGHCLLEQNKLDEALDSYKKVDEKYISKRSSIVLNNNIGLILSRKDKFLEAEKYLKISKNGKVDLGDYLGVFNSNVNLISLFLRTNQAKEARRLQHETDELIKKYQIIPTEEYFYNKAIVCYEEGNLIDGRSNIFNFLNKKDSISNAAFSDKLIEMQKSFELKEKDQEIALLQKEDALNQSRLKSKNILIAITSSFLLVLLGVGLVLNRQRKELAQSRKRLLRQKEDISGMNDQLRVSNLAKDRILSVIGHDLRGPVGGLKELIELYMELPEYEPDDIKNLLTTAREASTSTYHLLENLLSWANSQRGDIEFNPVATPLAPLVKQSVQLLDSSINVRHVRFEFDIPQALVIQADMNMLRTIIRNLVSNALKFSPENSVIKVIVIDEGNRVKICICDQGKGMTTEETQNIFKKKETYFIGSEITAKGTGLGLILCKEFVERHGGNIWIDSEEGVGTQVWFSIPQKGVSIKQVDEIQRVVAQ